MLIFNYFRKVAANLNSTDLYEIKTMDGLVSLEYESQSVEQWDNLGQNTLCDWTMSCTVDCLSY